MYSRRVDEDEPTSPRVIRVCIRSRQSSGSWVFEVRVREGFVPRVSSMGGTTQSSGIQHRIPGTFMQCPQHDGQLSRCLQVSPRHFKKAAPKGISKVPGSGWTARSATFQDHQGMGDHRIAGLGPARLLVSGHDVPGRFLAGIQRRIPGTFMQCPQHEGSGLVAHVHQDL